MKKNKYTKCAKEIFDIMRLPTIFFIVFCITWLIMGFGRQYFKHPEMIYNKNLVSTEIEQDISELSLLDKTYFVSTLVWVKDWQGLAICIEHSEGKSCVYDEINAIKTDQYKTAVTIKNKVDELIKK